MSETVKRLPLGPVNADLFRRVRDAILEEPRRLEMSFWGRVFEPGDDPRGLVPDPPPCGTVGCIAGWANVLAARDEGRRPTSVTMADDFRAAALLGLTGIAEGDTVSRKLRVFHVNHWPLEFRVRYRAASSPADRAAAAAAYINYLIGEDS